MISLKAKTVLFTTKNIEGGGTGFFTLKNLAPKYSLAF